MSLPRALILVAPLLLLAGCEEFQPLIVAEPAPLPEPAPAPPVAPPPPAPVAPLGPDPVLAIEDPAGALEDAPQPALTLVRPYRSADDACQLAGESEFTLPYLSDSADLVACPRNGTAWTTLVTEKGATQVARTELYTLYTVPRG